ncbi:MAG TPA: hypothetical protein VMZ30_11460 [Pyrinomonadaceae bacterium]|nr:hypothetical protein [Pyrinomonadaceae bacterium]
MLKKKIIITIRVIVIPLFVLGLGDKRIASLSTDVPRGNYHKNFAFVAGFEGAGST